MRNPSIADQQIRLEAALLGASRCTARRSPRADRCPLLEANPNLHPSSSVEVREQRPVQRSEAELRRDRRGAAAGSHLATIAHRRAPYGGASGADR